MDAQTDPAEPIVTSNAVGKKRNLPIMVLVGLIVIAAAGYGYWKLIYYPSTPQYAIDQFVRAGQAKDYDRIYSMVQVPPPLKVFVGSGRDLKSMVEKNKDLLPDIKEHSFGTSTITGDQATVETTVTGMQAGKETTSVVPLKLVKVNGVWLIDGKWILAEAMKRGLGGVIMNGSEQ